MRKRRCPINQKGKFQSPPKLSQVIEYNREIYDKFAAGNGRIIRMRSTEITENGQIIYGRYMEAENAIYLYKWSNMSTITEELMHFKQVSLLRQRGFKMTVEELEDAATRLLLDMGFTPWNPFVI